MNRHYLRFLCYTAGLLITASVCYGQAREINTISGNTISIEDLDVFLKNKMAELDVPGLSIAVINDAEIVYHRTLGYRNTKTQEKVNLHTIFEAASLTKPLFAYFVMRMVEKGVLALDAPLYRYLPNYDLDYDKRYEKITARMVLSHTTGMPNWRYENRGQYLSLRFDPGTDFSYSGEGYEYLGNVIAHLKGATKKELDALIKEEVFDPLGMERASFTWNAYQEKHKANGHSNGRMNGRDESLLPGMAGGLHTEAVSYAKFLIALMKGEGLSKASFNELLASQVSLPADHSFVTGAGLKEWTLGFPIEQTEYGAIHLHGGNNPDFQAYFEFAKDREIGYVYLTNSDRGDALNEYLKPYLRTGAMVQ